MSEHTPGPWRTDQNHDVTIIEIWSATERKIGEIYEDDYAVLGPEDWANARLIAAAPEMLEALKAVIKEYREGYGLNCVEQVRAAIAKAEGVTP